MSGRANAMKDYNELSAIQQYYMNKATEKARAKA